jgi:hypothetical protein
MKPYDWSVVDPEAPPLPSRKRGITDAMAAAAHDAWYAEKARRLAAAGLPASWPSETGEEQLVPWANLSESVREFDRIVISAALRADLPSRKRPYLAMAVSAAFVVGIVVAVWWWLS